MINADVQTLLMSGALRRAIQDAKLHPERPDFLSYYMATAERSRSGTAMPPSPGVVDYTLSGVYTGSKLEYKLKYRLRDSTKELLRMLPDEQIRHRSRDVALFLRPLQVKEFLRRDTRIAQGAQALATMRIKCDDRKALELWDTFVDETMSHMKFDIPYLRAYLHEHETSSSGAGYRWGELAGMPNDAWREVYDELRRWWDNLSTHRYDKMYLQKRYNIGGRARSNPIAIDRSSLLLEKPIDGVKDRDRATMFQPVTSMVGAFLPDKQHWYDKQLRHAERLFGISNEIRYPMLDGGQVYRYASKWLRDGYRHEAYDGGSWEAVVGAVLGRSWSPMLTCLGDYDQLPSGGFHTSLCGTLTQLVTASQVLRADDKAIILGDDLNIFTKQSRQDAVRAYGELIEYQEMDSEVQFILGVAYKYDNEAPRLQGFKLTTDRADKAQHVEIDPYGMVYHHSRGVADERSTALWLGMYLGVFGSKTLIDSIGDISAEKFRGGSDVLHKMAETGFETTDLEEAEAWKGR